MTKNMTFGKFKGKPIAELDRGYLMWCEKTLRPCPDFILDELLRRDQGAVAQKKPTKKQQRKTARIERRGRRQRAMAAENLERLRRGVLIPNSDFDRLRVEYVAAGGDLLACPFDTKDANGETATEQRLPMGASRIP